MLEYIIEVMMLWTIFYDLLICVCFLKVFLHKNRFNFYRWKTDYFLNVPPGPLYSSLVNIVYIELLPWHPYLWLTSLFSLMTP